MQSKMITTLFTGVLVCLFAVAAHAGENWHFPVGLAYVSGFSDVKDRYEKNVVAEGYGVSSAEGPPIGLMFQPYYQFPSGLGIGVGLGPIMIVMGDRSFLDVPVSVDARYAFITDGSTSPYIRAGVKKHIANGDYVNSSSIGVFGGAGVEFFRKKRVGMGIELLIDKSNVEFEAKTPMRATGKETIEPSKFLLSVSAIF